MNHSQALLIFCSGPVHGHTRTPLAADIGGPAAQKIQNRLSQHARALRESIPADCFVFYADEVPPHDVWSDTHILRQVQKGGDMGSSLSGAFSQVFRKGYERAVFMDCNCHGLEADVLLQAFSKLDDYDITIGPSADGRYYLLGLKQSTETLFVEKDWQGEQVYEQTVEDIRRLGLRHCRLPVLHTVNMAEDLAEYPDLMLMAQYSLGR